MAYSGHYLYAADGGSVPPAVINTVSTGNTVGETPRVWREADGSLRLRVMHRMDNGMINNIPASFIDTLPVSNATGAPLARLSLSEAVSENLTLTLLLDAPEAGDPLTLSARDNNGNVFHSNVPIPLVQRMQEGRL